MQRIEVKLGNRSYPIYIGSGAMQLKAEIDRAIPARDILVVTNTTVGPLYAAKLTAALAQRPRQRGVLVLTWVARGRVELPTKGL